MRAIHELGTEPNFCAETRPAQKYPLNSQFLCKALLCSLIHSPLISPT